MKKIIKNSIIAALAIATAAGASIGIATLSNSHGDFSQGIGFNGTYSLTAFAEEVSVTAKSVALVDSSVNVTETKAVTSVNGDYKLYVTAIDTGDINVSSVEVGYTYNGNNYNGAYVEGETGLSNVVYSSLSIRTSETDIAKLTIADMFASQITGFDGTPMLVVAEIPVVANAADATITIEANAIADFAKDFSIENTPNGAWRYGYVNYNWGDKDNNIPESFDFVTANNKNSGGDGWIAADEKIGNRVEIKKGWINANAMTTIAYTASEDMEVKVDLDFVGSEEATRLALRVGVTNSAGNPDFYGTSDKTLSVNKSLSLKAGDTVYFIFSNENTAATPNGALNIVIYKCEAFADFAKDFSIENNPNGAWEYGYVDYNWGDKDNNIPESFVFSTANDKNSDAWLAEGVEIKAGWINANAMTTIAYTASKDINIKVALNFVGAINVGAINEEKKEEAKLSLRIGIKDSQGNIYRNPDFIGAGKDIEVFKEYSLKAGDTIYFIFNNESSPIPNGALSIKLYK